MICSVCHTRKAYKHEYYGYLPCLNCRDRQSKYGKPQDTVEMTTEAIKTDRKQYADEIIQPFREGTVSKEYIDKYGTAGIKASKQEIKKAKNVWNELTYYKK